jgi:PKD repeat protein
MLRRALLVSLLALPLGACHGSSGAPGDAGPDALGDDGPSADVPGLLALDFAVTGCATYDVGAAVCAGGPPLTVTFSPVGSAALTRFQWTFGDGTPPSAERAPTHTYVLPGAYDVSLIAGGGAGTVSRARARFVQVATLPTGVPCDVDGQCATGLRCLCGASAPCGAAFPRGVCTSACPAGGCGAGAACAALDVPPRTVPDAGTTPDAGASLDAGTMTADAPDDAASADSSTDGALEAPHDAASDALLDGDARDAPTTFDASANDVPATAGDGASDLGDALEAGDTPATFDAGGTSDSAPSDAAPPAFTRVPVCLASCQVDADCATGLVCRSLPAPSGAARWVLACVPPFYRDLGATCRDASDARDDDACATGTCADLGALGLCSASCAAGAACPAGGACASFANGEALCVRACSTAFSCATDPLLACTAAGGAGALGFVVTPPATGATYCAPRACVAAADCAPAGVCTPLAANGHCTLP